VRMRLRDGFLQTTACYPYPYPFDPTRPYPYPICIRENLRIFPNMGVTKYWSGPRNGVSSSVKQSTAMLLSSEELLTRRVN